MWHSILDFFGVIDESGKGYGFFSGIGSDLGEIALIGAIYAAYRRHNCHVRRCWRLQRHAVEGTPWVVCRKHHPTIDHLPEAHELFGPTATPPAPQRATPRPATGSPATS